MEVLLRVDDVACSHEMIILPKRGFDAFLCLHELVSHCMSCVSMLCSRVSPALRVPLSAVVFGSHCVITAGCERAGSTARKQSSLINPC